MSEAPIPNFEESQAIGAEQRTLATHMAHLANESGKLARRFRRTADIAKGLAKQWDALEQRLTALEARKGKHK